MPRNDFLVVKLWAKPLLVIGRTPSSAQQTRTGITGFVGVGVVEGVAISFFLHAD
jgi:hypothetical protein